MTHIGSGNLLSESEIKFGDSQAERWRSEARGIYPRLTLPMRLCAVNHYHAMKDCARVEHK